MIAERIGKALKIFFPVHERKEVYFRERVHHACERRTPPGGNDK